MIIGSLITICNAHHIRELQTLFQSLKALLLEIVQETKEQKLEPDQIISYLETGSIP